MFLIKISDNYILYSDIEKRLCWGKGNWSTFYNVTTSQSCSQIICYTISVESIKK